MVLKGDIVMLSAKVRLPIPPVYATKLHDIRKSLFVVHFGGITGEKFNMVKKFREDLRCQDILGYGMVGIVGIIYFLFIYFLFVY